MTTYRNDLSPRQVRVLLDYYPETGEFIWLPREGHPFVVGRFNHDFAGKRAGTIDRRGYLRIKIARKYYAGHRLAWVWMRGEWPPEDIDHINCNKSDNKFSNLRLATRSQNVANNGPRIDNKTGFKGVRRSANGAAFPFQAQIRKNGTNRSLGFFSTAEQAHAAYKAAAETMFGEFARMEH